MYPQERINIILGIYADSSNLAKCITKYRGKGVFVVFVCVSVSLLAGLNRR